MKHKYIRIYADGASRNNPGNAAIGIVICDEKDNVLEKFGKCIGIQTNNFAEYTAVIESLKMAKNYTKNEVQFTSDSQLVVRQLNYIYKVKNKQLKQLFKQVKQLENNFDKVEYKHSKRENNFIEMADGMANKALDEKTKVLK